MTNPVTLSARSYAAARKRMGYSNYAFRRIIGVSLRQAQRYESDEAVIPETVAKLIIMLDRHGVPAEWK